MGSQWPSVAYIRNELKRIEAAGPPVDIESMTKWHGSRTQKEGSDAWVEIYRRYNFVFEGFADREKLPLLGEGSIPNYLHAANEVWTEESLVAEFLKSAKPYLNSIQAATLLTTPAWQPIEFQGFYTTYDQFFTAGYVQQVLNLEFQHALYHRDAPRTFEALRQLKVNADMNAQAFTTIHESIHKWIVGQYLFAIGLSLRCDLWDADQLEALFQQVGPQPADLTKRVQDIIAGERVILLVSIDQTEAMDTQVLDGMPMGFLKFPSSRAKLLKFLREYENLADGSFQQVLQDIDDFETKFLEQSNGPSFNPTNIAARMIMPSFGQLVHDLEQAEDMRRMTRTALAIKLFHKKFGRWPTELKELDQVGLNDQERTTIRSGQVGYSVEGTKAFVWIYEYADSTRKISTSIPDKRDEQLETGRLLLIR